MGLMDSQTTGNGAENGIPKPKGKYMRMDGEFSDSEETEEPLQVSGRRKGGRSDSEKYVFACAIFASLNNVLLGYAIFGEQTRRVRNRINVRITDVEPVTCGELVL